MSKIFTIGLVLVAVTGCNRASHDLPTAAESNVQPAAVTQTAFNTEGAPTVEFSVPDMVCEFSCVPEVRETLAKQPGVKDVKVVLDTHTATVAVDKDKFDADKAIAALVDLKFTNTKLLKAAANAKSDAAPEAPKS